MREKINDKLTFPFILNMNQYMNGYEFITNKLQENNDPNYFIEPVKTNGSKKKNVNFLDEIKARR